MSLFRIDGHVLPVDELYTWVEGFILLYRRGRLTGKDGQIPQAVHVILEQEQEMKVAADALLAYLGEDEDFMPILVATVKVGMTDLAIEKHSQ